jgi:hypothetical protein
MLAWALPFIWIGVSMSARRAVNAEQSPWLSLLFFVPVLNYLVIALLCTAHDTPARPLEQVELATERTSHPAESALGRLAVAARSVLAAAAFGALAVMLSVSGMQQYGSALFIGAPFMLGVISGVLLNRAARQSAHTTIAVAAERHVVGWCAPAPGARRCALSGDDRRARLPAGDPGSTARTRSRLSATALTTDPVHVGSLAGVGARPGMRQNASRCVPCCRPSRSTPRPNASGPT